MNTSGKITIRYLQHYLAQKDCNRNDHGAYSLKLAEEIGELARVFAREIPPATESSFKGSAEEELWDVLYYTLCIANLHQIDLEPWILQKDRYYAGLHSGHRPLQPDVPPESEAARKGCLTVKGLQLHFLQRADDPRGILFYFCKLCEEMGELIRVLIRGHAPASEESFLGSAEDALSDIVSYIMILADLRQTDLERWIPFKEALNAKKWNQPVPFDPEGWNGK